MAENKSLFKVDAGEVLAKLHLAAKAAVDVAGNKVWQVYNTGISQEKKSDTPENPSSTEFDLKNTSWLYELGVFKKFEHKVSNISEDMDSTIIELKAKIAKLQGSAKDTKMLDNDKAEKTSDDLEKLKDDLEKAKQKLVTDNKKRLADYEKERAEFTKKAFTLIKTYFTTFVGAKHSNKISETDLVEFRLPIKIVSAEDKTSIKKFKIVNIDPKLMAKEDEQSKELLLKNNDTLIKTNSGFKVGYSIKTDSM